jgi:hypothetical protein
MTPEQFQLLDVRRPPGRLTIDEAGACLGFAVHEMRVLLSARHIRPLGNPLPTGCKHFSSVEIERLRCDTEWLAGASDCIAAAWHERNEKARKKAAGSTGHAQAARKPVGPGTQVLRH